jgi:arabinoxylan arabinofuranohydrolase
MKLVTSFIILLLVSRSIFSQNPISPAGTYIADPSARVWNDGKLYIFGSLDESCEYYCSHKHHLLYTTDMHNWMITKDIFMSKGQKDGISYNDKVLYAPDAVYKNGTYYLYYCQPDKEKPEGVATSTSPEGPFTNGTHIDLRGYNQIDPAVFTDDDGQVYYIWGQFTMKMAKLKSNMKELDVSSVKDSILTEAEHHFHEGAFLAKRNGIYYLVYADISRGDVPTCIGYATATSPYGPYKYGGVIIDNNYCNPGNWNNHGSIARFKDKWYVFYHRSTHGCNAMRKACAEPITFLSDGSIPEVEMTSQGAGNPLDAKTTIQAERACLLSGNLRIEQKVGIQEGLEKIYNGDKAAFKYINFAEGVDSVTLRIAPGTKGGKIFLSLDKPWQKRIATLIVKPNENNEWLELTFKVENTTGVHALWMLFYGEDGQMFSIDWLKFK